MPARAAPPPQPGLASSWRRHQAAWAMVGAALLFSTMGVAVKKAAAWYTPFEIVGYRGLVGMVMMALWMRAQRVQLGTHHPGAHAWRAAVGVAALVLWFVAIAALPLGTAVTLNYTSSLWMAALLLAAPWARRWWARLRGRGDAADRPAPADALLLAAVVGGFVGVALVLRPSGPVQAPAASMAGLLSGLLSAFAYLQVRALGRLGEPEPRTVFYFSAAGAAGGLALQALSGGFSAHQAQGLAWVMVVGVLASLAQWLMTRAYAVGQALSNATLAYLGIVFSFLYGLLLFDESAQVSQLLGAALIIVAGVVSTARSVQARRSADAQRAQTLATAAGDAG